mmetsp:Transcript_858/g.1655  ORF Transcript_858/g.1655 Transcript_858/m.1655 type:complete len:434 (-) Transcript_858:137-1438(-)
MDVSRNIASLLGTPKRRRIVASTEVDAGSTPPTKSRRQVASSGVNAKYEDCKSKVVSEPVGKTIRVLGATSPGPLEQQIAETTLLAKTFAGLEDVLMLRAQRDQRAEADSLKRDVESLLGRDFGDDRLARVLYVAGSMLDAQWKGRGTSAVLELRQRVGDRAEIRPPRPEEAVQRRIQFAEALRIAAASNALSLCHLPERPTQIGSIESVARSMAREREEATAVASTSTHVSLLGSAMPGTQRLEALRNRVLQKQDSEAERSAHRAAVDALEKQMCTCEDAMAVHAVVQQLFARGTGNNSAASEAEVVAAVCSESFSAQCRRPLSRDSARTAMAYLERRATDWYHVEAAVHSRHAGAYLRRISGGSSEAVRESLSRDICKLKERHSNLLPKPSNATTNGLTEAACPKAVGTAQQTAASAAMRNKRRRKTSCKQ